MKIVEFKRKLTPRQQQVQDSIVEGLERHLAFAKQGVYLGVQIVAIDRGENNFVSYKSETDHIMQLTGALSIALHSAIADMNIVEDKRPTPKDEQHEETGTTESAEDGNVDKADPQT